MMFKRQFTTFVHKTYFTNSQFMYNLLNKNLICNASNLQNIIHSVKVYLLLLVQESPYSLSFGSQPRVRFWFSLSRQYNNCNSQRGKTLSSSLKGQPNEILDFQFFSIIRSCLATDQHGLKIFSIFWDFAELFDFQVQKTYSWGSHTPRSKFFLPQKSFQKLKMQPLISSVQF